MKLQHAGEHRSMRWANGLGTTQEVIAVPSPEQWEWRLSLAAVTQDGPFSVLDDVDRALVVARGNGMTLHVGSTTHDLSRFDVVEFPGDVHTIAELTDGRIEDLNLMVRRGSRHGHPELYVERFESGERIDPGPAVALVVLDGAVMVTTPTGVFPFNPEQERASRFDALIMEPMDAVSGPSLKAMAFAVVAFARFRPHPSRVPGS